MVMALMNLTRASDKLAVANEQQAKSLGETTRFYESKLAEQMHIHELESATFSQRLNDIKSKHQTALAAANQEKDAALAQAKQAQQEALALATGVQEKENQIAQVNQEKDAALAQAKQAQQEAAALATGVQEKESQIAQVNQEKDAALAQAKQAQQEALALATGVQEKENQIAQVSQEKDAALAQAKQAQQEALALATGVQEKESQIAQVNQEKDAALAQAKQAQQEAAALATGVQEKESQIAQVNQEKDAALAQAKQAQQEAAALATEVQEKENQIEATAQENDATLAQMANTIAYYVQLVADLKVEGCTANHSILQLRDALQIGTRELQSTRETLTGVLQEANEMKQSYEACQRELVDLKHSLEAGGHKNSIKSMEGGQMRQAGEVDLPELKESLEASRQQVEKLKEALKKAMEVSQNQEGELKKAMEAQNDSSRQVEESKKSLALRNARVVELKESLNQYTEAHKKQVGELGALKVNLEASHKQVEKLKEALKASETQEEKLKEALKASEKQVEKLKEALKASEKQVEDLKEEMKDQNNRMTSSSYPSSSSSSSSSSYAYSYSYLSSSSSPSSSPSSSSVWPPRAKRKKLFSVPASVKEATGWNKHNSNDWNQLNEMLVDLRDMGSYELPINAIQKVVTALISYNKGRSQAFRDQISSFNGFQLLVDLVRELSTQAIANHGVNSNATDQYGNMLENVVRLFKEVDHKTIQSSLLSLDGVSILRSTLDVTRLFAKHDQVLIPILDFFSGFHSFPNIMNAVDQFFNEILSLTGDKSITDHTRAAGLHLLARLATNHVFPDQASIANVTQFAMAYSNHQNTPRDVAIEAWFLTTAVLKHDDAHQAFYNLDGLNLLMVSGLSAGSIVEVLMQLSKFTSKYFSHFRDGSFFSFTVRYLRNAMPGAIKLLDSLVRCPTWVDSLGTSQAFDIVTSVIRSIPSDNKHNTYIKCACVIIGLLLQKLKSLTGNYHQIVKDAQAALSPCAQKLALSQHISYVESVITELEANSSVMPAIPPTTGDQNTNQTAPSGPLAEGFHNGTYYGLARTKQ
jgi:hypothetical protein